MTRSDIIYWQDVAQSEVAYWIDRVRYYTYMLRSLEDDWIYRHTTICRLKRLGYPESFNANLVRLFEALLKWVYCER